MSERRMTATEELRKLLDERGVEYREWDGVHPITIWHDEQFIYEYMERTLLNGVTPYTGEVLDGSGRLEAVIHDCTPKQAVAATVGNDDTSRWHELFGAPERASRTLETVAETLFSSAWSDDTATLSDVACALSTTCGECPAKGAKGHGITTRCGEVDYDALIEWLGGDA